MRVNLCIVTRSLALSGYVLYLEGNHRPHRTWPKLALNWSLANLLVLLRANERRGRRLKRPGQRGLGLRK